MKRERSEKKKKSKKKKETRRKQTNKKNFFSLLSSNQNGDGDSSQAPFSRAPGVSPAGTGQGAGEQVPAVLGKVEKRPPRKARDRKLADRFDWPPMVFPSFFSQPRPPSQTPSKKKKTSKLSKIQQTVARITDVCWDTCITGTPGRSFSSKESACMSECAKRFIETTQFVIARFQSKAREDAAGGGGGFD